MKKVFIDGSSGTTGLKIYDRLKNRNDLELIILSEDKRKDPQARKEAINSADVVFLCLPDDASREAVTFCDNKNTVIIDTSTAFRTNSDWTYGFPELKDFRNKIKSSKRIANPGCHASGFLSLITPLIETGAIKPTHKLSCFSLTGFSGGGKKMIAEYEEGALKEPLNSGRLYGLTQNHKHLPEMVKISGINNAPVFAPIVVPNFSGMEVVVQMFASDFDLSGKDSVIEQISSIYKKYYNENPNNKNIVKFAKNISQFIPDKEGFLPSSSLSGRDDMLIGVVGNDERILLVALYDNLGKGASGAAIQNMNIALGADETTGLIIA